MFITITLICLDLIKRLNKEQSFLQEKRLAGWVALDMGSLVHKASSLHICIMGFTGMQVIRIGPSILIPSCSVGSAKKDYDCETIKNDYSLVPCSTFSCSLIKSGRAIFGGKGCESPTGFPLPSK